MRLHHLLDTVVTYNVYVRAKAESAIACDVEKMIQAPAATSIVTVASRVEPLPYTVYVLYGMYMG